jgi:hypothetical protein
VADRVVYKFPLQLKTGPQFVPMPKGAGVVHVHEQDERPCLWALCDSDELGQRVFWVFATGEKLPPHRFQFYGTVHIGWTVWHVFEEVA